MRQPTRRRLTYSQLDRMFISLGYSHARRRLPESRWWLPVAILLVSLIVLALTASHLPGGW